MILRAAVYRKNMRASCDGSRRCAHQMCGLPATPTRKETVVTILSGKAILITGGNRGIGHALTVEALKRGAGRVYVGTRKALADTGDSRVTPLTLDITDKADLEAAAGQVDSLDIVINNAGLALYDDLSDPSALQQHLAVNLFGTYAVIQTFLPLLVRSGGSIVNNLSVNALAPLPLIPAYSVSKAAAFSMTQSLRAMLAGQGVRVHAVLTGPVDTEMTRGLDIPKASPQSVAHAIFDGVENDDDEIFPDPLSRSLAERWDSGAIKVLERQYAALLDADH
nr:SDR family NAD(P)-dependent oxidoreductase [Mycobacterium sp. 852002-30065_SCH5024008]